VSRIASACFTESLNGSQIFRTPPGRSQPLSDALDATSNFSAALRTRECLTEDPNTSQSSPACYGISKRLEGLWNASQKIRTPLRRFQRVTESWTSLRILERFPEDPNASQNLGVRRRVFGGLAESLSASPKIPGTHRTFQLTPESSARRPILL